MTKDGMKGLLFEILEGDSHFKGVRMDAPLDAIVIRTAGDRRFILKVDYLMDSEDIIRQYARDRPTLFMLQAAILKMSQLGIIGEDDADMYLAGVSMQADRLGR